MASASVAQIVGTTGRAVPAKVIRLTTDPLQGLKDRLYNWGRSCRAAMPNLSFAPPPIYEFIYQTGGKGKGKTVAQEEAEAESGTASDTDDAPDQIDEADAQIVSDALWRLGVGPNAPETFPIGRKQFMTLKRHFYNQKTQPRDMLDEAVRALGDKL